jgi:hypothetical protein
MAWQTDDLATGGLLTGRYPARVGHVNRLGDAGDVPGGCGTGARATGEQQPRSTTT